jgi:hypothetical protein
MANLNPYVGSHFRSVNTELITGKRTGGYRPGNIGVSEFQGKVLNYDRPGVSPLRPGAGVSVMQNRPASTRPLNTASYSLYSKSPENALYANLYRM